MYYVGIDIAKSNHEATIVNEKGEILGKSISFPNSKKGLEKLLFLFKDYGIRQENVIIAMEATGHYWLALYSALVAESFNLKVINPIQSSAFRKLYIRKLKTDSKDSFIIAQLIRFGEYSESALIDEATVSLKQLSRYRIFLINNRSDWKRKVITLLDQVFPEYEKIFFNTFCYSSLAVLLEYPTALDIANAHLRKLTTIIRNSSKGRLGRDKALELKTAAKNSFGVQHAKDGFAFQMRQMVQYIIFSNEQIQEVENEIESLVTNSESYLTSITGISKIGAATLLGEIGDISRFEKANQLVAFTGLDVSVNQSGQFTGNQNKLTKRGSPYLRRALWHGAVHAAFHDPYLSIYYQKLRNRGKHHSVAISAVARKLCNIIFAIMRDNKPYYVQKGTIPT